MNTGKVKWFNAEKGFVSSKLKAEKTYSYISQQSLVKASRLSKKVKKLNSKSLKATAARKLLTL